MKLSEEYEKKVSDYIEKNVMDKEWTVDLIHKTLRDVKEMLSTVYPDVDVCYSPIKSEEELDDYDVFSIVVTPSLKPNDFVITTTRFSVNPPAFDPMIDCEDIDDEEGIEMEIEIEESES